MTNDRTDTTANPSAQLREQATVVGQDVQELGRIAKDAAQETWERSRGKAEEWEKSLENQIRKHPLQSLLIAGGVGLVIGVLLGRK
jgi:ElaB/YqjD/DUF883 family membrane-anchored ribosome-binding protein